MIGYQKITPKKISQHNPFVSLSQLISLQTSLDIKNQKSIKFISFQYEIQRIVIVGS